ncbi:TPA: hypothetical protein ACKOO4_003067 [Clostridioides difficile]|nr:hypothetical protein [Clostridioides difficile]
MTDSKLSFMFNKKSTDIVGKNHPYTTQESTDSGFDERIYR